MGDREISQTILKGVEERGVEKKGVVSTGEGGAVAVA
jgi:hypothetical protein